MSFEAMEMWEAMKSVKYRRTLEELRSVIQGAHGNLNEAITSSLNKVCSAVHAEVGTFWFYSRYGDGLIHPRAGYGGRDIGDMFLSPGEGIAGQVIMTGEPIMISDCQKDLRWSGKVDDATGFTTRSMLCVPLKADGVPFGCIQIINKTDGTLFDEKELDFQMRLAEEISSQFVSLNILADGKVEPDVVVLYADIRGFTEIAEQMDLTEVAALLNEFLAYTTACIKKNHGTADKYIGDCVMAYWVPSGNCQEPEYMACRAAMDMVSGASELQKRMEKRFGCTIQFGVGINCGPAYIGNIGSSVLTDHTVVGDTVNTAAQLVAKAPAGEIYISRRVADALGSKARLTSLGTSVKLKKQKHCEVFSLDGMD